MTFDEFKKMVYHTKDTIRIPGSRTVIDKKELLTKGKYDSKKGEKRLERVYEEENFKNR